MRLIMYVDGKEMGEVTSGDFELDATNSIYDENKEKYAQQMRETLAEQKKLSYHINSVK